MKQARQNSLGGCPVARTIPVDIEIADAIRAEILADLSIVYLVGDELFRIGKIDAVMAGEACGGQLTRMCTSLAPASRRFTTRARAVVPRTIESSTTTTRFPATASLIRFSFTRTLKSRMSCVGWRKVRPM